VRIRFRADEVRDVAVCIFEPPRFFRGPSCAAAPTPKFPTSRRAARVLGDSSNFIR
jgi:hypothetical protein